MKTFEMNCLINTNKSIVVLGIQKKDFFNLTIN